VELGNAGRGGNIEHRTSNIEHRTSNIEHRTSKGEDEGKDEDEHESKVAPALNIPDAPFFMPLFYHRPEMEKNLR